VEPKPALPTAIRSPVHWLAEIFAIATVTEMAAVEALEFEEEFVGAVEFVACEVATRAVMARRSVVLLR